MLNIICLGLVSGQLYPVITSCLDCTSQNVNTTKYSWCDLHASPVLSKNCFDTKLDSALCKKLIAKTNANCYDEDYQRVPDIEIPPEPEVVEPEEPEPEVPEIPPLVNYF